MNLTALLRKRYAAPEWAFFSEVANGTGAHGNRRIDGLAMNLYPSRGLRLHGFECKISRSDFTRELKNPDKAEAIARYCHHWWIVAPAGLIRVEELPPNWGLLAAKDEELRIAKQAELLPAVMPSYEFMAAVLRRACESSVDEVALKAEYQRGNADGYTRGRDERSQKQKLLSEQSAVSTELQRLRKRVDTFQAASGVTIESWNITGIGERFKQFMEIRDAEDEARDSLARALRASEKIRELLSSEVPS